MIMKVPFGLYEIGNRRGKVLVTCEFNSNLV